MLDKHILADEVSHLLKTKYANTQKEERPYDLAFTDVADKHHIMGNVRGVLKSEIGSILAKRPRKPRSKDKARKGAPPRTIFCILKADAHTVEISSQHKVTFKFGKDIKTLLPVCLWHEGAYNASTKLGKAALAYAEEFFQIKKEEKKEPAPLVKKESETTRLILVINGTFEVLFVPTDRSVAAHVTHKGKSVRQKDVPQKLMRQARAIALTHFKNQGTLPLDFG